VNIGPVDPEIVCLKVNGYFKTEMNTGKTYSTQGMHATLAKLRLIKCCCGKWLQGFI